MDNISYLEYLLPLIFFAVAFIYSSVGMGGGSSYTAIMVIANMSTLLIPIISLSLNLFVSTIGSYNYLRNKHGKLRIILPFLLSALPFAYLGGALHLAKEVFLWVLLASLILVAIRIYFWKDTGFRLQLNNKQKIIVSVITGSILGLIAGIAGIGGAVYLVPLIIMLNVGTQKEAAAAGVVFVWTVSFVGLISRLQYNSVNLLDYSSLIIAVIIGGFLGSYMGSFKFNSQTMEKTLGMVILLAIFFLIKRIVF